jgi:hypothetical protein
MAKEPGFAKAYAGRRAHYRNGHQATFANAAGFFNSLLGRKAASGHWRRFWRIGIMSGFDVVPGMPPIKPPCFVR